MPRWSRFLLAAIAVLMLAGRSDAVVVFSEDGVGEFSGDSTAPTDLGIFMPGVTMVSGEVTEIGMGGFNGTADVITFQIAVGTQLQSIDMESFSAETGSGIFLALDDDSTFLYTAEQINDDFSLPDLTQILGGTVVGEGDDILAALQRAERFGNGSVFDTPLGAGFYSMYMQETGPSSTYSMRFEVTSVPEPSTFALMAASCVGLLAFRRRRSRRNTSTAADLS